LGILAFAAALGFEAFDFFSHDKVPDPIASMRLTSATIAPDPITSSTRLISATIARSLSPATSPVRFMAHSSPQNDPISVPDPQRAGNARREM
jgi:hypothetical protein